MEAHWGDGDRCSWVSTEKGAPAVPGRGAGTAELTWERRGAPLGYISTQVWEGGERIPYSRVPGLSAAQRLMPKWKQPSVFLFLEHPCLLA